VPTPDQVAVPGCPHRWPREDHPAPRHCPSPVGRAPVIAHTPRRARPHPVRGR
jgi:hypothetical protein